MPIKTVYLIIFAISSISGQFLYDCPKIITGCTCAKTWANSNWNIKVQCNAISDRIAFSKNLKALNGYSIDELWITTYLDNSLPDSVFPETSIRSITILTSPSLLKFGQFFDGLGPYLHTIRIESSPNIKAEQWEILAESLTDISVLKNILLFSNINAYGLSFTSLDSSLKPLQNIERIVNRRNKIQSFTISEEFPNLQIIDLSENFITQFSVLSPAPSLSNIYLQSNGINVISQETFENILNIQSLDLTNNKISCYCEDIDPIVSNQSLAQKIKGNCYSPKKVAGTRIGAMCATESNIIKYFDENNSLI